MTRYAFEGTETLGFLLRGHLPRDAALALLGGVDPGVVVAEADPDRARAALLVVRIEGLRTWGLPFPRWTYPEALWLLELAGGGHLAVRAHGPRRVLPALARLDRYRAAAARIAIEAGNERAGLAIRAGAGVLEAELEPTGPLARPDLISALWTRDARGRIWRVPWGDDAPESAWGTSCRILRADLAERVLGPDVRWDPMAVVYRGRPHRCAPARPESPPRVAG